MENFQQLVMKIATAHQLTSDQKTHVQNRLNQFFSHYRTPDHPPYSAIIERAIVDLDEDGGSSEESISQFLVKEYTDLPWAHATLLKHHLAKLCESGVIISTQGRRYALAGTNFSLNTTSKSKRKSMERVWKWDCERQLKRRRCKKQLSHKRNQQKGDEQLEVIEKHSEHNVQEKLLIEGVQGEDKYSELSNQELPPPGFESIRLGNLSHLGVKSLHDSCPQESTIIQVQEVTSLSTYSECDQLQFGSLSSEERWKVRGTGNISAETVIMSVQAEKSSQALVVAASKKRFYRKRLRHELLSKTLRRSSRLQNISKPTDEEEKELNLSVVESQDNLELAQIEECPKLDRIQGQLRRSKRLAESAIISKSEVCDLLTSNPSSDLKILQDGHITGKEIVLHVMQQKEPKNQEPELLRADMTEIKPSEVITYVRRKKAKFQVSMAVVSDAEKELALELPKTPTSSVCEAVIDLNNLLPETVKEASTNESHYELQPDSRKRLRGCKRKFDDMAVRNLRFSARLRENGLLHKMEHGEDVSCNAMARSAGDTLSPRDFVPNDKKNSREEFPKIRRLPKRRRVERPPNEKIKSPEVKEVQVLQKLTTAG